MEIRAGSGLGDSIYLQSIARHLKLKGQDITARSNYPDLFKPAGIPVNPFHKVGKPMIAHYAGRKKEKTDQFQDMCITAGIKEPVELRLDWIARENKLSGLKRPALAVMLPRQPMNRKDNFGKDLLPDMRVMQELIDSCNADLVLIGSGKPLYELTGLSMDMSNKTTISELLDIASLVDGFIGYCSFMIPLAESLNKPYFALWSSKGLESKNEWVRLVTPEKIIHKKDLGHYATDDHSTEESFNTFLRQATCISDDRRENNCLGWIGAGSAGELAGVH